MSAHSQDQRVSRTPLLAVASLIGFSLLLVAVVRFTGVGDLRTPQATVVAERLLRFTDQPDGGIRVQDAASDLDLARIEPGGNGFLRGTLRGLSRERKRQDIGPEPALRLSGRSDGRLVLEDPQTGRLIDLGSFGPTNAAVFARLLTAEPVGGAQDEAQDLALNHRDKP